MESYKILELKNDDIEYKYDYNFLTNNLYNVNIQEENEKRFDILLDGILSNNINSVEFHSKCPFI